MSDLNQLTAYLDRNGVSYQIQTRMPPFSVRQGTLTTHASESGITTTLVVQAGKQKWMVVLRGGSAAKMLRKEKEKRVMSNLKGG